jgi:hypothetical protein
MKKHLLHMFLVLFLCSFSVYTWGQRIHFTDTTNRWKTTSTAYPNGEPIYFNNIYEVSETPVEWDGKFYSEIRHETGGLLFYTREDTAARKIYIKSTNPNIGHYRITDTNEFVYMDFSLNEGDTFSMPIVENYNPEDSFSVYFVAYCDSALIGTQWYKRMEMRRISGIGYENFDVYFITEGIGHTSGPVIETRYSNEWGPPKISCFSNQGQIPNPPFFNDCFSLSVDEGLKKDKQFVIYPNPAYEKINVVSKLKDVLTHTIIVKDIMGRLLIEEHFKNDRIVTLHNLTSGIYTIHILHKGGLLQVEKLIVQ